jgi:hypothetical protein
MARSVEDVRRELRSERADLTDAVGDLRAEGGRLRSKLPLAFGGAVASLLALRAVAKRAKRA